MSKAKNSPLRDYMLSLHKQGRAVSFCEGNGTDEADQKQRFFIKMPSGASMEEHLEILRLAFDAVASSADMSKSLDKQKLTRQLAASYIEKEQLFKKETSNK